MFWLLKDTQYPFQRLLWIKSDCCHMILIVSYDGHEYSFTRKSKTFIVFLRRTHVIQGFYRNLENNKTSLKIVLKFVTLQTFWVCPFSVFCSSNTRKFFVGLFRETSLYRSHKTVKKLFHFYLLLKKLLFCLPVSKFFSKILKLSVISVLKIREPIPAPPHTPANKSSFASGEDF